MDTQKFNGWANHATWCVKLWMDNDEGFYRELIDMADRAEGRGESAYAFGDTIEEWWGEQLAMIQDAGDHATDCGKALLNDMLGCGLNQVQWEEIAESLLEDARERAAA